MFGDIDTTVITDALQKIREGWGLARDAAITFQQAVTGSWIDDATGKINPLHEAIGNIGTIAHDVFDWLVTTGIPELTTAFTASMPANIQLVKDLGTALTGFQGASRQTSAGIRADIAAWFDPNANPAVWINVWMQSFNWLGTQTHAILTLAGSDWKVFWGQVQSAAASIGTAVASFGSAMSNMFSQISAAAGIASTMFSTAWLRFTTAVTVANDTIVTTVAGLETKISTVFASIATTITGAATTAWTTLSTAAQTASTAIGTALSAVGTAVSTMASTIGTKIDEAVTAIGGLPAKAVAALGDLGGTLKAAGTKLVQGLIDGINSKFEAVKKVLGSLTAMLPSWKGPPATDAKLLYDNGRIIIGGFVQGLRDSFPTVQTALGTITGYIGNTVSQTLDGMAKYSGAKDPFHYLAPTMRAMPTWVGYVQDLGNGLRLLGDQTPAVQDLGDGLKLLGDQWARQAASMPGMQRTGAAIVAGVKLGVLTTMPDLLAAMRQSTDSLIQEIVGFIDSGDTTSTLNAAGAAAIKQLMAGMNKQTPTAARSTLDAIRDLLKTGDFKGGIFDKNEDDPFIDFLLTAQKDATATKNILDLLATGDFRGGILGLQEDDPFIVALLKASTTVTDLAPKLPQLADGFSGVADAAKTAAAATVRATDDMLSHIKMLGGGSLDAMGGYTGGKGGGLLSYLNGAAGAGGGGMSIGGPSYGDAITTGQGAGMGFGNGWQAGIEQIQPQIQD
jgi:hypothetical protein